MPFTTIQPYSFIALRLPSGLHKIIKIVPHTTISLGKYGSFPANLLLGRPFFLTFEIIDDVQDKSAIDLRIVPAAELHAEALSDNAPSPSESPDEEAEQGLENEAPDADDEAPNTSTRDNRLTIDDPTRQTLSSFDIEELKKACTGSGKEIIAKIMQSHSALDEKTAFSLAKYTLRKVKKYMKRFTALPLDVSMLAQWMLLEKEPLRTMELREEMLGLISSWSNVHADEEDPAASTLNGIHGHGRWLVTEDAAGLIVALLAERMGILYPDEPDSTVDVSDNANQDVKKLENGTEHGVEAPQESTQKEGSKMSQEASPLQPKTPLSNRAKRRRHAADAMSARSNSITLIHPATQPNISLLSYFSYNPTDPNSASPIDVNLHPLHSHLKTLTWLQLIDPSQDTAYEEPEKVSDEVLASWKSGKRSTYFRKRRRWENIKRVVDETRAGGFDGLVVATFMEPISVLHETVPLLRGGAQVVVYSPTVEPLAEVIDVYSTGRKTAFLSALGKEGHRDGEDVDETEALQRLVPSEEFPVDPRLLLAPNLHTVRAREWQVLPGRTHPMMTGKGGAEGYLFTATRVIPVEGRVEAKGRFTKRKKLGPKEARTERKEGDATTPSAQSTS